MSYPFSPRFKGAELMHVELTLSTDPLLPPAAARVPADNGCGAVITFLGVVRGSEGDHPIWGLEYTAFEAMARHQFDLLFVAVSQRWPIHSIRLIHRLGAVAAGEPSLWIEVTSPHRREAFAACQWIIDEMKRVVPIWKRAIPG